MRVRGPNNREFTQRRRRRLRKRYLKSEFGLPQTLSRLFHLVYFVKCWQILLQLNCKGLHQSSGREKENCCLLFPSSTKREIRPFHVAVVQLRHRNVQKSVMHVQSCCFACLNLLLFCRSRCHRRRRCVSSVMLEEQCKRIQHCCATRFSDHGTKEMLGVVGSKV